MTQGLMLLLSYFAHIQPKSNLISLVSRMWVQPLFITILVIVAAKQWPFNICVVAASTETNKNFQNLQQLIVESICDEKTLPLGKRASEQGRIQGRDDDTGTKTDTISFAHFSFLFRSSERTNERMNAFSILSLEHFLAFACAPLDASDRTYGAITNIAADTLPPFSSTMLLSQA